MIYGMYVSAGGALANSYRQDVIANNIANVDTVGFKQDLAMYTARPTESQENGQRRYTTALLEGLGGGTFSLPTYTDHTQANLEPTGRNYDLALEGNGFFQVKQGDQVLYTRDGRFTHNTQNQLVMVESQLPVLDIAGNPIEVNPTLDFVVNENGTVSQNGQAIANLSIVEFNDTNKLTKQGGNLYINDEQAQQAQPSNSIIKQGYLEGSGVVAADQLVQMMKTQRMFEANMNMVRMQNQTMGRLIQHFGQ